LIPHTIDITYFWRSFPITSLNLNTFCYSSSANIDKGTLRQFVASFPITKVRGHRGRETVYKESNQIKGGFFVAPSGKHLVTHIW